MVLRLIEEHKIEEAKEYFRQKNDLYLIEYLEIDKRILKEYKIAMRTLEEVKFDIKRGKHREVTLEEAEKWLKIFKRDIREIKTEIRLIEKILEERRRKYEEMERITIKLKEEQ